MGTEEGNNGSYSSQYRQHECIDCNPTISFKLARFYLELTVPIRIVFSSAFLLAFLSLFFLAFRFGKRAMENNGFRERWYVLVAVVFVVLGHVAAWLAMIGFVT